MEEGHEYRLAKPWKVVRQTQQHAKVASGDADEDEDEDAEQTHILPAHGTATDAGSTSAHELDPLEPVTHRSSLDHGRTW